MSLYRNKYRIESSRLPAGNYEGPNRFFLTICTKERMPWFGTIRNGEIVLSEIGQVVKEEWLKTQELRRDMNLSLDEFIIMPDHFHGIIFIGKNSRNLATDPVKFHARRDARHGVSTRMPPNCHNAFGPQTKNLASIVRGFKSSVTIRARKICPDFGWQARYHDRIIRDLDELEKIRAYIINNPNPPPKMQHFRRKK